MKKLFLGVMMVALIITSCNKYANDFQALKDQIAALATQVTGVTTLEQTIASQTATIAALQTAIAALPSSSSIAAQFTTIAGTLSTIQGNINSISTTLASVATTGTANAAALATLQTTLNGVVTAKTAADAALNATLATLQSTLAADIAAGTTANATAIAAAQTAILGQITASSMSTDANVNAKIAAAQTALETLINTGLANTNANVNTQVAAAQTALTALINSQLAAVQTALQTSIADGTTATNAHTDAQIAALTAVLNAGLAGVNSNVAGVSSQVTAAQTAILALVTSTSTTLSNNIAAAQLALENLVNSTATSTQNNINSTIASLQAALTVLINAGNGATIAQIQATQAAIIGGAGDTATSLTIHGLQLALGQAQAEITLLLNSAAMYNGDVTIQGDADVTFFLGKINQMGIINGNLSVNTTNVTNITGLNTILGNIGAIIGVNSASYSITTTSVPLPPPFNVVTSVTLNTIAGAGHWVWIADKAGDNLAINNLTSVRGDYTVQGADIADLALATVGGTVTLNYPGKYEALLLASVGGNLILVDQSSNGTGYINFPVVTVDPAHFVGNGAPGGPAAPTVPTTNAVAFNSTNTTWVNFGLATGAQINTLTADYANSVVIGTIGINAGGLTIVAPVATTVTLAATSSAGVVTVATGTSFSTGTATTVDLSKLVTSGPLTVWAAPTGNVKLDNFNSTSSVDLEGPLTVTIPVWYGQPGASLNAPFTQTLTLPLYRWWSVTAPATIPTGGIGGNLAAIKHLTLGNALENVDLGAYSLTLLTADITGAAFGDATHWATLTTHAPGVTTAGDALLTTLTLGGIMNTVNLTALPLLTSFTTSGVINTLILDHAAIITGLNLGHSAFVGAIGFGGTGSDLWITNNAHLAGITSSTDWMHSLVITGNTALAHFNLSSYSNDIYSGSVNITIDEPSVQATYVHAIQTISSGNPGIQAQIHSSDIMTLKPYLVQMLNDIHIIPTTFGINVGTAGPSTLTADLNTDNFLFNFAYVNNVFGGGPLHTAGQLGQVSL